MDDGIAERERRGDNTVDRSWTAASKKREDEICVPTQNTDE